MAFTATILAITRSDTQIIVETRFDDSASGYTQPRVFAFNEDVTIAAAQTEIIRIGKQFKAALAANANLQQYVGNVITVP